MSECELLLHSVNAAGHWASEHESVLAKESTVWSECKDGERQHCCQQYTGEGRIWHVFYLMSVVYSLTYVLLHSWQRVVSSWAMPCRGILWGTRGFLIQTDSGRTVCRTPPWRKCCSASRRCRWELAWPWQHSQPGKGHLCSSWYLEPALVWLVMK